MTPQLSEALALARSYTERCDEWPVADFPLDHDKSNLLARALLSLAARVDAMEAVVGGFVNEVSLARRQRATRGTGAMGASMPGCALSYIQPSAMNELVRFARNMEIAMNSLSPDATGGEK